MSRADVAFDSNILLYLASADQVKAGLAEDLLSAGGTISVQALNEFASVARRKFRMEWSEIGDVLRAIRDTCEVRPITVDTHERGIAIAERFGFGVYDSLIIASALESGCVTLFSEDMQHGQTIGAVTVANPFVQA